jgi:signal transduction histidine kinase
MTRRHFDGWCTPWNVFRAIPCGRASSAISNLVQRVRQLPAARDDTIRSAVTGCGLIATYVALDWVSFIHEYRGSLITPWSPGIGLLFALIVRDGAQRGLLLFMGGLCAEIAVRGANLDASIAIASATIVAGSYTIAAVIARRYLAIDVELSRLRDVVWLIAVGVAGATVAAMLLSSLLIASGRFGPDDFFPSILRSIVGDMIGIAVVSPLVLRLPRLRATIPISYRWALACETALYGALVFTGFLVVFNTKNEHGSNFFYLLFLPTISVAMRFGLDGACIGLLATQIGLVYLLQRDGSDAEAFIEFQELMFALTATSLVVGAIVGEREQAQRALQEAERRLKRREYEAIRAGRFSLVNAMAAALSHEINQPITAARALARSAEHLLQSAAPNLSRAESNITASISQIDAAAQIIRRMRDFLRRGRPSTSEFEVRDLVEDSLLLVRPESLTASIQIETFIEGELPPVHGDRGQLEQVILNLLRNSIEAIAYARQPDGYITVAAARSPGRSELEISVQDNGPGVAPEVVDRIFEPLTSSKEEGLGLGLSICESIVEAHAGKLWLERTGSDGTEFRLSIPLGWAKADDERSSDYFCSRR